jgi:hypothetical protein
VAARGSRAAEEDIAAAVRVLEIGQRVQQALVVDGLEVDAVEHQPPGFEMVADVLVEVDAETVHALVDRLEHLGVPRGDFLGAAQRIELPRLGVLEQIEPAQPRPVDRDVEMHERRLAGLGPADALDAGVKPVVGARHVDQV